jgi:hypothetical protein
MEYSETVLKSTLLEFANSSGISIFHSASSIEEAGKVASAAIPEWSSRMAEALPRTSVDWKQFSLSISKLALYDVYLLIGE